MLKGRPRVEPRRLPGADTLLVSEVYVSLQGESTHQGLVCTFVRLTGCHLRCTWCDSAFAFEGGTRRSVEDVVAQVKALGAPLVEVTGGEPLLQPAVYPLLERLLAEGFQVLLETSGAIDVRLVPPQVRKIVDLKAPGSGESDRNDWRVLESLAPHDELKFVLASRQDYDWAKEVITRHGLGQRPFALLFSAVFGVLEPRQLAEWVVADLLPVRVQLQQHKVLWPPDARGV